MNYRGVIEKKIGGKKRKLRFGMNTWMIMSKVMGKDLGEIIKYQQEIRESLKKMGKKGNNGTNDINIDADVVIKLAEYNRNLVYAGLAAYEIADKKLHTIDELSFTEWEVGNWIDEMTMEDFKEILAFANKTEGKVEEKKLNAQTTK